MRAPHPTVLSSSLLPFEMAKCRTFGSTSTRRHWRGPRRWTRPGWRSAGHLRPSGRGRRWISRGSPLARRALVECPTVKEIPMYDQSKLSELIRFARVDAGSTVIDVYPGDGDWTRLFSDIVGPEGRVYSFVPAEVAHFKNDPVGRMRTLAKEPGRENVEAVSADLVAMPEATPPADGLSLHPFARRWRRPASYWTRKAPCSRTRTIRTRSRCSIPRSRARPIASPTVSRSPDRSRERLVRPDRREGRLVASRPVCGCAAVHQHLP